jgi:Uma2 family endonuclease
MDEYPDLAIEVAPTSGGLPKLPLYERLRVREVWLREGDGRRVFGLTPGAYEPLTRGLGLAEIDLELLGRFVRHEDPPEALKAYREALRSAP